MPNNANKDDAKDIDKDIDIPLIEHLNEVRAKLLRCLLVILLVFIGLFPFASQIYTFFAEPLRRFLPEGATMIATNVATPFLTPFKLTAYLALFISIPFILHEIWTFIYPALTRREKRFTAPILFFSVILFYAGMLFAYFVVFPLIFAFFISTTPDGVQMMTDIASYLDFIITLFFAFGIAFEVPIIVLLLIFSNLLTVDYLRSIRPYIIVGCFVIGMILTPPDVFSQTMLALPMIALYEIGILCAKFIKPKKPKTPI